MKIKEYYEYKHSSSRLTRSKSSSSTFNLSNILSSFTITAAVLTDKSSFTNIIHSLAIKLHPGTLKLGIARVFGDANQEEYAPPITPPQKSAKNSSSDWTIQHCSQFSTQYTARLSSGSHTSNIRMCNCYFSFVDQSRKPRVSSDSKICAFKSCKVLISVDWFTFGSSVPTYSLQNSSSLLQLTQNANTPIMVTEKKCD